VRRRVGMDAERVLPLSRLPRRSRRAGRIQWQVHVRPVRVAGRLLRHARRTFARDLPQLLLSASALAVHRRQIGRRRMTPRANTMRASQPPAISAEVAAFGEAVLRGLSSPRKRLPCQYFYDAVGSELFGEITRLEEYYPTRTETAILREHARSMVRPAGRRAVLVEFGSGSSRKTELVLAALEAPRAYAPIDVSQSALAEARDRLEKRFPGLEIAAVNASFCEALRLPARVLSHTKLGFFP